MNLSPSRYASEAAGNALHSEAWLQKQKDKQAVSTKVKEVKLIEEGRAKLADALARPLDAAIDHLMRKVDEIMRRGQARQLLDKLQAILPDEEA